MGRQSKTDGGDFDEKVKAPYPPKGEYNSYRAAIINPNPTT